MFGSRKIIDILKLNEWKDILLSLNNRKQRILKTIRNSEELREGAIEQLEKARARLRKVETEVDHFRANGYSEIEREKLNLINSIYTTLEQFEKYKNETIRLEQQRAINQVQLWYQSWKSRLSEKGSPGNVKSWTILEDSRRARVVSPGREMTILG
ncbi:hypothetical protein Lal_00041866 [Lupinus albus]|nr:hypothetical protein Lal_00041866 [Lupinus albus]